MMVVEQIPLEGTTLRLLILFLSSAVDIFQLFVFLLSFYRTSNDDGGTGNNELLRSS